MVHFLNNFFKNVSKLTFMFQNTAIVWYNINVKCFIGGNYEERQGKNED